METTQETSATNAIINGVKKALTELEEFRVQAALGKAEAHDAFEGAKKKFNEYLHEARQRFESAKDTAAEKSTQVKTAFETLQVQLALGKAETKEVFEEQRKKIFNALNELETIIKRNNTTNEYYNRLQMELEKFRIKVDIIKLRYDLNKLDARSEFESKKTDFSKKLDAIKKRLEGKEAAAHGKWDNFKDEITEAYSHLRNAIVG